MENSSRAPDPELLAYLQRFVTEKRLERMNAVLDQRTRYLTVVLEDIFQPHNASAVLRSCDAFGIQDVHIIENRNAYRLNPDIELGTSQWLTLQKYRAKLAEPPDALTREDRESPAAAANSLRTLVGLRDRGYRIAATVPRADGYRLSELPLEGGPIALVFGTELTGLSRTALDFADLAVAIPMHGFVESFNISVSAALCLYDLSTRLRESQIPWRITQEERQTILYRWLKTSIKKADALEREFLSGRT